MLATSNPHVGAYLNVSMHVFLYIDISEILKPYGKKWLKPLFHIFQDLVMTYSQKIVCCGDPGVLLGHAALGKACHQFYFLIPCVQACSLSRK